MKISKHEEANYYFDVVKKLINEYIHTHHVKASELYKYLRGAKLDNFIKKNKLTEVENIKIVIKDVIEHKLNMELDLIPFSKFNESLHIAKPNSNYERILSDLYHTNLSNITLVDSDMHKYEVDDLGDIKVVYIFSENDMKQIKKEIIDFVISDTKEVPVQITTIDENVIPALELHLWEIYSEEKYRKVLEQKIDEEKLINILASFFDEDAKYLTTLDFHVIYELDKSVS